MTEKNPEGAPAISIGQSRKKNKYPYLSLKCPKNKEPAIIPISPAEKMKPCSQEEKFRMVGDSNQWSDYTYQDG